MIMLYYVGAITWQMHKRCVLEQWTTTHVFQSGGGKSLLGTPITMNKGTPCNKYEHNKAMDSTIKYNYEAGGGLEAALSRTA